ncbi:MAG: winged helix-turn-helix transcriptional regulator [Anaerolineales bacterium]|nr:winged helix-turn-helix transcriptional regulator [Anaerolineales bacterium]
MAPLAQVLKALGEPNRLRIVNLLMEGVQCNCELGSALDMAPNLISHHLRVLREIGLVQVERDALDARWLYYSLNVEMLTQLSETFGHFFDASRIRERLPACGPQATHLPRAELVVGAT